ncbi:MAG: VanW family protein [Candidatus Spechtbacterales bacterium]
MKLVRLLKTRKLATSLFGVLFAASIVFPLYSFYYSGKILPHVFVSAVDVGGITRQEAADRLEEKFQLFFDSGILVDVEGNRESIDPKNIDLKLPSDFLSQNAWSIGREGKWHRQLWERLIAPFIPRVVAGEVEFNEEKLESEIDILSAIYNISPKDIRYEIKETEVSILYDTKPGKVLDIQKAKSIILSHIKNLDTSPIAIILDIDMPKANLALADEAKREAEQIIAKPLTLLYSSRGERFVAAREKIASWIISLYRGERLVPDLDEKLIGEYVTELAAKIDVATQNPKVIEKDGRVVDFMAPRQGITLLQDDTVGLITKTLQARLSDVSKTDQISLPVLIKKPKSEGSARELGIVELIGKATTPFTGSPQNRVHNITNGLRFLTGIIIPPGAEFSTVGTLGEIDNTTGYLPELVIKGDETIPEFGGGLCQVSTTLFRSVLNAGLPVLQRRNHSYRVPYYEKDGEGNFIGPGLDATIYSPQPDFKFKNDTKAHILIQGFAKGDTATFELYGTSDGRKSFIDGPYIIEETPPGEPIYIETDALPKGETKKIDTAHKGGSAVATYKIEYPDGSVVEQEFKSFYRRWSDKYLVGTATTTAIE